MKDRLAQPARFRGSSWSSPHRIVRMLRGAPRATYELSRARLALRTLGIADIEQRNALSSDRGRDPDAARPDDAEIAARAGFVIERLASRMPFRSDCLVRALAAQSWLTQRGIATRIVIGAQFSPSREFGPHAWLSYGETIVTGGDVAPYTVLYDG
ncbi:lasso peptide biosynthesis B2 protein [Aurantiacibacter spongiae]|uniref:Lasso peptide biosynthesis B2 protein n=1 Tax=Aurantiacibacter spongiae TaxID=2488860 RepID=A0A3N5DL87_9SPHN|nr:lasso peptide biosynthesis B2 protein [Aurantiacibacter spongiae]RPF71535.1 lasso peptide biosynthesis B2 protein [Aurantiacibacter spongiae]